MKESFFDFRATTLQGKEVKMDVYRGSIVLVVNTASLCGLTPQMAGLQKLHEKYSNKGLVILGFPCNQFGSQEPGDEKSIAEGCVLNYGVTFQMFSKVDVNGPDAHPIFAYLQKELKGILGNSIKWNFTKFLINREGMPIRRFSPMVTPEEIDKYLQKYFRNEALNQIA